MISGEDWRSRDTRSVWFLWGKRDLVSALMLNSALRAMSASSLGCPVSSLVKRAKKKMSEVVVQVGLEK